MIDKDMIVEAEQRIQTIADELSRMRDCATALEDAHASTESALRAAERVIEETGRFAELSGAVISRLESVDLVERLDLVLGQLRQGLAVVEERFRELSVSFSDSELRVKNHDSALSKEVAAGIEALAATLIAHSDEAFERVRVTVLQEGESVRSASFANWRDSTDAMVLVREVVLERMDVNQAKSVEAGGAQGALLLSQGLESKSALLEALSEAESRISARNEECWKRSVELNSVALQKLEARGEESWRMTNTSVVSTTSRVALLEEYTKTEYSRMLKRLGIIFGFVILTVVLVVAAVATILIRDGVR